MILCCAQCERSIPYRAGSDMFCSAACAEKFEAEMWADATDGDATDGDW